MFSNDAQKIMSSLYNITHTVIGTINDTDQKRIFVTPPPSVFPIGAQIVIDEVALVTETPDAIDGTDYWSFNVLNVTDTADLLDDDVTNFTGGTAISADIPYRITPDQNNTLGANKVLELDITKTASAANLLECSVVVHWHWEV